MANEHGQGNPEDLGQDPYVERLRPDPSQPPEAVRIIEGLLGDSDKEGYKRLYFTRELDNYVEFRVEDVVFSEPISPDQSPFLGQQATRVGIRRDATIEYTQLRTLRPVDEFDLDIRLEAEFEEASLRQGRVAGTVLTQGGCGFETQCGQWTCNHPGTINLSCFVGCGGTRESTCAGPTCKGPRCNTRLCE